MLVFSLEVLSVCSESNPQCHLLVGTEPGGLLVSVLAEGAAEPDSELPAGGTPAIPRLISGSEEELRGCFSSLP